MGSEMCIRDRLHSRLFEKVDVQGVETIHFSAHALQQIADVRIHRADADPIGRRIPELVTCPGAVHQQLFGDTAPDHTGPANPVALDDRDLGTMTRCPLGGGQAAGASPKDNEIKIGVHSGGATAFILMTATVHGERLGRVSRSTTIEVKTELWSGEGAFKDTEP